MYEEYWGFHGLPFQIFSDLKFYYSPKGHEEAIKRILYAIKSFRGSILLTGDVGSGKTMVIRVVIEKLLEGNYEVALVNHPTIDSIEFIKEVLFQFDIKCDVTEKREMVHLFYEWLITTNTTRDKHAVLIIDEAHLIKDIDIFEELKLFSNFQLNNQPLLTLVLVGQPEIRKIIHRVRSLEARVGLKYHLFPLTLEDTKSYIKFRLELVGGDLHIFTDEAITDIYRFSRGLPREINKLCDMCLFEAYLEEKKLVDSDMIRKVGRQEYTIGEDREIKPEGKEEPEERLEYKREDQEEESETKEPRQLLDSLQPDLKNLIIVRKDYKEIALKEIEKIKIPLYYSSYLECKEEIIRQKGDDFFKIWQKPQNFLRKFIEGKKPDPIEIFETAGAIIDSLAKSDELITTLFITEESNDLTTHLINVAIISTKIGLGLGFGKNELMSIDLESTPESDLDSNTLDSNNNDLTELVACALLHDIGTLKIREEIISKKEKLTDVELKEIRMHPQYSCEMLESINGLPPLVAHVAYQEHEREDGSGYPLGLKGEKIHEYAKIVGLADIYVAMLQPRPQRDRKLPFEIVKEIIKTEKRHFPDHLIKIIINELSFFPVGLYVTLNTGEIGRVKRINKLAPMRPVVEITKEAGGRSLSTAKEYDLMKEHLLRIENTSFKME